MSKLEDLSINIQLLIFAYLDLNSLLRCRLVCKNFLNVASQVRIFSLFADGNRSLSGYAYDNVPRYFYTHEFIDYSIRFSTSNLKFFKSNLMKLILFNIKQLYLEEKYDQNDEIKTEAFNLGNINQLQSLEHLELSLNRLKGDCYLNLINLRILHFERLNSAFNITLDTPNLYAFKSPSYYQNNFTFLYPKKITYLSIAESYTNFNFYQFLNVNFLFIDSLVLDDHPPNFSTLIYLKELHFQEIDPKFLRKIWHQKRSSNLDFNVYLGGFKIDTEDDTKIFRDELDYDKNLCISNALDFTHLISTNYSKTSSIMPNISINDINYHTLMQNFQSKIPDDFHKKVISICILEVTLYREAEIDQKLCIEFLRKNQALFKLHIRSLSFDQRFFNELHSNSPLLRSLTIDSSILPIDLDLKFLLKCKRLRNIEINYQNVCLDLVKKAFNVLEFLQSFMFLQKYSLVELSRTHQHFKLNFIRNLRFDDLDSLISLLKKQ